MLTGPALIRFQKQLLSWFADARRDLPWRRTRDPYRIWLSEIMLQQTRVAAAIPYYERLLKRCPNVRALAEAPEEELLRLWAGLGYYSRVRNLQKAARQIVNQHNSRFPEEPDSALALPGIGQYSVAAILSIAYGKKLAVLDGNVARVVARLGGVRGDLRRGGRWKELQGTADALLAARQPGNWNQAIMELGATLCTPRSPQCLLCPVTEFCKARKLGLTTVIPEKRNKRATEKVVLAALVLVDPQGRTLLLRPPESSAEGTPATGVAVLLSHMWHFPTIPVQRNAAAELQEFASDAFFKGVPQCGRLQPLPKVSHAVTYRQITLLPYGLKVAKLPHMAGAKILLLSELSSVPISNLTRKVALAMLSSEPHTKTAEAKRPDQLRF